MHPRHPQRRALRLRRVQVCHPGLWQGGQQRDNMQGGGGRILPQVHRQAQGQKGCRGRDRRLRDRCRGGRLRGQVVQGRGGNCSRRQEVDPALPCAS